MRDGHGTSRVVAGAALACLLVAGCSGGGSHRHVMATPSSRPDRDASTPGSVPGGPSTRTLTLDGASLLVPDGALASDDPVSGARADGDAMTAGAVTVARQRWSVDTKATVRRPLALRIPSPRPTGEPPPIGVVLDEATGAWLPANSTYEDGVLVIYVARPGRYGTAQWSWPAAAAAAREAVRTVLRAPAPVCPADGADASGAGIAWCRSGDATVEVVNQRAVPLVVAAPASGVEPLGASGPLLGGIDRAVAARTGRGGAALLAGGQGARLTVEPGVATEVTLSSDARSRTVSVLAAAAVVPVALRTGRSELAVAAVRSAAPELVAALADPACLDAASAAASVDRLGEPAALDALVRQCMPAPVLDVALRAAERAWPLGVAASPPGPLPSLTSLFGPDGLRDVLRSGGAATVVPPAPGPEPMPASTTPSAVPTTPAPAPTAAPAPTTAPAPTAPPTTVAAAATTTVAPTTLAPTTVAPPPAATPVVVLSKAACEGKSVKAKASGLTPGGPVAWSVVTDGAPVAAQTGRARDDGTAQWTIECKRVDGPSTVQIVDATTGRASDPVALAPGDR